MSTKIFNLLIALALLLLSCSPIKKLYVPFGEAKSIHASKNDDVIRIYFDRMGFIYPEMDFNNGEFKTFGYQYTIMYIARIHSQAEFLFAKVLALRRKVFSDFEAFENLL